MISNLISSGLDMMNNMNFLFVRDRDINKKMNVFYLV